MSWGHAARELTLTTSEERPNAKVALRQSKVSTAPRRPSMSHGPQTSLTQASSSRVHPPTKFEILVSKMSEGEHPPTFQDMTDFKTLTDYFMRFWKAPHAAAALTHLEKFEIKRTVRNFQKLHGFWQPPPEVAEALKTKSPATISNSPDTKDSRNLKFVLKILGCPLHENKPYKQFLKAKTLNQKRNWLYKYQGPTYNPSPTYIEPVCPNRLKRLYHFFPHRFTNENGFMYFNDRMLSYDEVKNVFYIGKELGN